MSDTAIIDAALKLAASQAWKTVTLDAIAAEAGTTLAGLAKHFASKQDILRAIARRFDRQLLASLESDPVDGEDHDRLFDITLRRVELLAPHKPAIASILKDPADGPAEWLHLISSAVETQSWILIAAKQEASGARGDLKRLWLAKVFSDTLRIWIEDDDAGMARTMAALDRKLRDGADRARRLDTPITILSGFCRALMAARDIRRDRNRPKDADASAA
jgi:ubiquinone biosynthesis protein COQ9